MVEIVYRQRVPEKEALVIPLVKVPQRVLPVSALEDPGFPRSPKAAWKAALLIPGARVAMSYSVGPLMSPTWSTLMDPEAATLVLWVDVAGQKRRMRAWWANANKTGWKYMGAQQRLPVYKKLSSEEMKAWLTGP